MASTAGEVWRNARSELGRSFDTRVSRRAAHVKSLAAVAPTPAEVADDG